MSTARERLLIGVGNEWRGDDGAGIAVARLVAASAPPGVAVLEHDGEPASLLEAWRGARIVVLVDASVSGAAAGTVRRIDALAQPLPAWTGAASTHGVGVADAVGLARALDRLPERLVIFCIEGASFGHGAPLSAEVQGAARTAAADALAELALPATG